MTVFLLRGDHAVHIGADRTASMGGHMQLRQLLMNLIDAMKYKAGQIFNPFFTTGANDTLIGLRISRFIIELSGGRLWAFPSSILGANFRFVLSAISQVSQ